MALNVGHRLTFDLDAVPHPHTSVDLSQANLDTTVLKYTMKKLSELWKKVVYGIIKSFHTNFLG